VLNKVCDSLVVNSIFIDYLIELLRRSLFWSKEKRIPPFTLQLLAFTYFLGLGLWSQNDSRFSKFVQLVVCRKLSQLLTKRDQGVVLKILSHLLTPHNLTPLNVGTLIDEIKGTFLPFFSSTGCGWSSTTFQSAVIKFPLLALKIEHVLFG